MNKDQFLAELYKYLSRLPEDEKHEIMYDYEEHFRNGLQEGKSELTIVKELGSPQTIARQYYPTGILPMPSKTSSTGARSVLILLALLFFNLVIVLGPAVGLVGVLIGLGGAALGMVVGGFALLSVMIFPFISTHYVSLPTFMFDNSMATGMLGVGFMCLGILLTIAVLYMAKGTIKVATRYIQWNINTVRG